MGHVLYNSNLYLYLLISPNPRNKEMWVLKLYTLFIINYSELSLLAPV
jgi:hypothetical protein